MPNDPTMTKAEQSSTFPTIIKAAAILIGLTSIGIFVIYQLAINETKEGLERWRDRMDLIAESRATDASAWLNRHLGAVDELSADASLQLYATMITDPETFESAGAQRGFVYALLSAESERAGFHEKRATDSIDANVKRPQRAGLAVFDKKGRSLVSSVGMPVLNASDLPSLNDNFRSFIKLGPMLDDKIPLVIFGAAINVVDGMGNSTQDSDSHYVAWVIGARPLDAEFWVTLQQPGNHAETAETYVISAFENQMVQHLTPLQHGGRIGAMRQDTAAHFAALAPGGFDTLYDYNNNQVLVTGRELSAPVDWILVHTITKSEAFTDITDRRDNLVISLSLTTISVLAIIILAWRHGVSQRLEIAFQKQAQLSAQNTELSKFLQSVSDSQPTAIAAINPLSKKVQFANKQMETITGISVDDLLNRRIDTAFSSNESEQISQGIKQASSGQKMRTLMTIPRVAEFENLPNTSKTPNIQGTKASYSDDTPTYIVAVDFLPLGQSVETSRTESQDSVLMVMQDITELMGAHQRGEKLLKQLVSTLTQIIDARDPWSKFHSKRVAGVASAIACEMKLDTVTQETCLIAGQLVNIGKVFVPTAILTKDGKLAPEEVALIRESMTRGARLVADLHFDGPVGAALAQIQEHVDGSGSPKGLLQDEIEKSARILAVANAFVGMVSARAHRAGLLFNKAIDILSKDTGCKYERRVVTALQNILENKGGYEMWESFSNPPED